MITWVDLLVLAGTAVVFGAARLVLRYVPGFTEWLFKDSAYPLLSPIKRNLWENRFLSVIHAIIVTVGACIALAIGFTRLHWSVPQLIESSGTTVGDWPEAHVWMSIACGYFTYDAIFMIIQRQGTPIDWAHHIICTSAFLFALFFDYGLWVPLIFLSNEVSTPFLHWSWMMQEDPVNNSSKKRYTVQAIFALLFIFNRVIINALVVVASIVILVGYVANNPGVPYWAGCVEFVFILLFFLVQCIWGYKIVLRAIKAFSNVNEASQLV